MNYQTISEIYQGNAQVREKLKATVENLSDEQINFRSQETGWTIKEIVEHLSLVENGMAMICARLLEKARQENLANAGNSNISPDFLEKAASIADRSQRKVQAPDRVLPTGNFSLAESLGKMAENSAILQQLRKGLETIDTQKQKFPHPFFGDLNAAEWLALIGGHEMRHLNQIEEILLQQK